MSPDRRVYYSFSAENIQPVPDADPVDEVAAESGTIAVTLKAYRVEPGALSWWVTDEREVPPVTPAEPVRVPREARIEHVNVLLHAASGRRRLFIAKREADRLAAPILAHSLATLDRNEYGFAERGVDPRADLTRALGLSLWIADPPGWGVRH